MHSVDYGQAWHLWQAGRLSKHTLLFGVSIFRWGRVGRVMLLASGLIIVLDLVNVDRLRAFAPPEVSIRRRVVYFYEADRRRDTPIGCVTTALVMGGIVLFGVIPLLSSLKVGLVPGIVLIVASALVCLAVVRMLLDAIRTGQVILAKVLSGPRTRKALRWSAFILFLAGSHFDLLAS